MHRTTLLVQCSQIPVNIMQKVYVDWYPQIAEPFIWSDINLLIKSFKVDINNIWYV